MSLQVHPSVPAKTLAELFEQIRKKPGGVTMASPGAGTSNHLLSKLLQTRTGLKWVTVHYKGNAPATNDLLAGHVQFNFDQVSVALPFIKQQQVRPLVVTSRQRQKSLPDVPTLADPAVIQRFEVLGAEARAMSPDDFVAHLRKEYDLWAPVIRQANIKAN